MVKALKEAEAEGKLKRIHYKGHNKAAAQIAVAVVQPVSITQSSSFTMHV